MSDFTCSRFYYLLFIVLYGCAIVICIKLLLNTYLSDLDKILHDGRCSQLDHIVRKKRVQQLKKM